jgi:hypothetical protein
MGSQPDSALTTLFCRKVEKLIETSLDQRRASSNQPVRSSAHLKRHVDVIPEPPERWLRWPFPLARVFLDVLSGQEPLSYASACHLAGHHYLWSRSYVLAKFRYPATVPQPPTQAPIIRRQAGL